MGENASKEKEVDGWLQKSFLVRATEGHSHLVPPPELTWTGPWDHNVGCLDVLSTCSVASMKWRDRHAVHAGGIEIHPSRRTWGSRVYVDGLAREEEGLLVGLQPTLHHHLDNILLRVLMAWLLLSNKPRFKP